MKIHTETFDDGRLLVNRDFTGLLEENGLTTANDIWKLKDQSVKKILKERTTGKVYLSRHGGDGKVEVFIKRYTRVPARQKIKDAFSLKFFQFDALHEWNAQLLFHLAELPTVIPIAAGRTRQGTFNLTLGIQGYERASVVLERMGSDQEKQRNTVIEMIAKYVGRMHQVGLAHQDLYLVHFFLKGSTMIPYLIDLQRVIIEKELSDKWRIKDLAELLFSARPVVSDREIKIFCKTYSEVSGIDLHDHPGMIRAIRKKADRIESRHRRKMASSRERS